MNRWILCGWLLIATTAYAEPDPAKRVAAGGGLPVLADAEGRFQLQAAVTLSPVEAGRRYTWVSAVPAGREISATRFALAGTQTALGSVSCASLPDAVFANGFEN